MTQQPTTLDFSEISLRERERAFLLGGTGSGKTTLEEMLIADFYNRYKTSRTVILDSKPRFRAEWHPNGTSAKRTFKHWKPGPTIPGSVLIQHPSQLSDAWALGARIVVAQAETSAEYPELVNVAETFYRTARHSRPQLLCVDETADYFHQNGSPIGRSDALVRIARSGRERGTAALYCSQRAKSIPSSIIEELTQLYLFALDGRADLKRCIEMGAPEWIEPPEELLEFMLWTKRDRRNVYGPFKVALASS
jgi:energy-coupling factor transporter ATP-binding protein EcfA2